MQEAGICQMNSQASRARIGVVVAILGCMAVVSTVAWRQVDRWNNGVVVPPSHPIDAADAITRVLDTPQARVYMRRESFALQVTRGTSGWIVHIIPTPPQYDVYQSVYVSDSGDVTIQ